MLQDDILLMLLREGVGQAIDEWDWDDVVPLNDDAIAEEDLETQSSSDEIEAAWEMEDELYDEIDALRRETMDEIAAESEAESGMEIDYGESLWQSPFEVAISIAEFASNGAPSPVVTRFRKYMAMDATRVSSRQAARAIRGSNVDAWIYSFHGCYWRNRSWKRHRRLHARKQVFPRRRKEDLMTV